MKVSGRCGSGGRDRLPDVPRHDGQCFGSARSSVHNRVFLKGMMAVLEAAPEYDGTALFRAQPAAALRAFGRLYAGWALSQDFCRAGLHLSALGAPDLDTFLRTDWEERFARRAAADLLAQLRCWDAGDIAHDPRHDGDLARACVHRGAGAADALRDRSPFPRGGQRGRAIPRRGSR